MKNGKTSEGLQWLIIAIMIIAVFMLIVNALKLRSTAKDISRDIGALRNDVLTDLPAEVPSAQETSVAATSTGALPPNVMNIVGTRASVTVPGGWTSELTDSVVTVEAEGLAMNPVLADLGIAGEKITGTVQSAPITEEELQTWFTKNKDRYIEKDEDIRIGPNQVLVAGKIGMDVVTFVEDEEQELAGTVIRWTFVRDGGVVIIFRGTRAVSFKEELDNGILVNILEPWNQMVETLQFGSS